MSKLVDVELYVAMNEDGDWSVVSDESEALSQLAEDQGGYNARVVKITVRMSPPTLQGVSVTVPDDAGRLEAISAAE